MKSESSAESNARLGLKLFAIYCLFYLAFVGGNAFFPQWAVWQPAGGMNLTTWWGLGLIGLAFLLSLVYGWLCRATELTGTKQGDKR